ncbi:MAG: ribosomal protein S19 family protein [Thermotogota bacterium]
MAKKIFTYRGKTEDELKALSVEEFIALLPAAQRRKFARGFTDAEKIFLKDLEKHDRNVKTHCRDMLILPSMIGKTIGIHTGKAFQDVTILPQMVGHRLGEFALTRSKIKHGAVGVASAIKH